MKVKKKWLLLTVVSCMIMVLSLQQATGNNLTESEEQSTDNGLPKYVAEPDIYVHDDLSGGTHEYLASNAIIANNVIYSNTTVHYGAIKQVTLVSGFIASRGCSFLADTNGYTTLARELLKSSGNYTNIIETNEPGVTLFPNPAIDIATLIIPEDIGEKLVLVHNTSGAVLYQCMTKAEELKLDLAPYDNGMYIVTIHCNDKIYTEKLLINR